MTLLVITHLLVPLILSYWVILIIKVVITIVTIHFKMRSPTYILILDEKSHIVKAEEKCWVHK